MLGNIKRIVAFCLIATIFSVAIYFNYLNIKTIYVGLTVSEIEDSYIVTNLVPSGAAYFEGVELGDRIVSVGNGDTDISEMLFSNGRLEQVSQIEIERDNEKKFITFKHSNEFVGQLFSFVLMPIIFLMFMIVSLLLVGVRAFTHRRFFYPVLFLATLSLSMVSGMLSSKQFVLAQFAISVSMLILPYLYFKLAYIKIQIHTDKRLFSIYNVFFGLITTLAVFVNLLNEGNKNDQLLFGFSFLVLFTYLVVTAFHSLFIKETRHYILILLVSFILAVSPFALLTLLPVILNLNFILDAEVAILSIIVIPLVVIYLLATDRFFIKYFSLYRSFYFFLLSIIPSLLSVGIFLLFVNAREYEFMLVHLLYVYILLGSLTFFSKDILDRKLRIRIPSARSYYQESLTKFSEILKQENKKDHIMMVLRKEATAVLGLKNVEIKTYDKFQSNVFDPVKGKVSWFIAEDGNKKYVLHGNLKRLKWLNSHQRDWLFIISSYISMKFENLRQMDEVIEELRVLEDNQEENQWVSTLFFKWSERERLNLALDIHDTLLQDLILHLRQIEVYKNKVIIAEDNRFQLNIRQIEENARDLILVTRETLEEIQPLDSKTKSLKQRLQEFIDSKVIRTDFKIDFLCSNELESSSELETNIFRIAQELINNGIKHSKGNEIIIKVERKNQFIWIDYNDDGIGIVNEKKEETNQNLGMFGIQKRVQSSQGEFLFHNKASGGLVVQICLPLNPID